MKHCFYIIITLLGLAGNRLSAQLFPVDAFVSTPITLPANVNALGSEFGGINLTLILRDAAIVTTEVRLRFYLEKNGVQLVTSDEVAFAPVTLLSNTPLVLSGSDLLSYFLPQSFTILEGVDPQSFLRSGGDLPEGLYTICIQVLDFRRFNEAPLSDRICSLTSMDLLDPPFITTPYADQVLEISDTLVQPPLDINWLMNYSTMIFPVDYQLYIHHYDEVAQAFGLGNDFFRRQPLFEAYLSSSTLILNNYIFGIDGEVEMLRPGERYVLRIQATSPDQRGYFRNQGFSDPVVFQYGRKEVQPQTSCLIPEIIMTTALSETAFAVSWTETPDALSYAVVLRQDGMPFDSLITTTTEVTLTDLDPTKTYQGMIWVTCPDGERLSGAPFYLKPRQVLPAIVYKCGLPTDPLLGQNIEPLLTLQAGDTIIAGDFKVKLQEVQGEAGIYHGTGVVIWNFPLRHVLDSQEDQVPLHVTFDDIQVNTDYFMYDGFMQIQGVGVNLVPREFADFMREFGALDFVADDYKAGPDLVEVDFQVETLSIQPGSIVITGSDEEGSVTTTIPWDGVDLEIFTSDGQVIAVDEEGNWSLAGTMAEGGKPSSANTAGVNAQGELVSLAQAGVQFASGTGQYGFDAVSSDASEAERRLYPATVIRGSQDYYYSPFKLILKGQSDVLVARILDEGIHPDSLVFKTASGRKIPHLGSGNELTLTVQGFFSSATETIFACQKVAGGQEVVGTFRLVHVPGQEVNVVLIPLGEASIPSDLSQTLRETFAPAAVNLQITTHAAIPLPDELIGPDRAIDTEGSGTFVNYSEEQQAINQYLRGQLGETYSNSTYYLVITSVPSSTGLSGYMPLARQFGYVFSGSDAESTGSGITAAHELGHGIFGLEHPFSRFGIAQGTTDWLMDYSRGTALPQVHWMQMYDPEFRLYLFQRDAEGEQLVPGEAFIYANYVYFTHSENPNQNFAGLTPSGERFILPSGAIAAFYPVDDGRWPQGALAGFQTETVTYYGWWAKENQHFLGYAPGQLNEDHSFTISGDYHPGLGDQEVPVFTGRTREDCLQEILRQAPGASDAKQFAGKAKMITLLPLDGFAFYQSAEVPQTNCGCYQGACQELLETHKNHPFLLSDHLLKRVICANPCVLKDLEQYPFFYQPTSEWIEQLNNICASLLAFGFTPVGLVGVGASTEGLLAPIIRGLVAQPATLLTQKFTIGSMMDMLTQTAVNYFFPDNERPVTWEEAVNQVDLISSFASGAEAMLLLNSHLEEAAVAAAISCFLDGSLEEGKIRESFDVASCARGTLSALLVHGLLDLSGAGLAKVKKLPADRLVRGLFRLFSTMPPGTYAAGFEPDGRALWSMINFIRPHPMPTSYVKDLFQISDDHLADDLVAALEDPQLHSDLLESGYFLKIFNLDLASDVKNHFVRDLLDNKALRDLVRENEGAVRAWEKMFESADPGIKALRTDLPSIQKFDDIVQNNNLGLDDDGLRDVLNSAAIKGQVWDEPGKILEAVKRASDANIPGLVISHKKFPTVSNGNSGGYLIPAKQYQSSASGDANLSFEVGGRSFDNVAPDGKLVDRKYGHGNSIFDIIENDFGEVEIIVTNKNRIISLLEQAKAQLKSANNHPIRWEISTAYGTHGIREVFNGLGGYSSLEQFQDVNFSSIEIIHVPF